MKLQLKNVWRELAVLFRKEETGANVANTKASDKLQQGTGAKHEDAGIRNAQVADNGKEFNPVTEAKKIIHPYYISEKDLVKARNELHYLAFGKEYPNV